MKELDALLNNRWILKAYSSFDVNSLIPIKLSGITGIFSSFTIKGRICFFMSFTDVFGG